MRSSLHHRHGNGSPQTVSSNIKGSQSSLSYHTDMADEEGDVGLDMPREGALILGTDHSPQARVNRMEQLLGLNGFEP
uniref:Uncharacterized protein n=1 Tax=Knipowitschia caucasica TaxID=637954 RepID=A0AAV2KTX8_KNICA